MYVQEFRDVVVPLKRVFLAERGSNCGRLLLDEGALICDSLQQMIRQIF